jgi:hypothetical protein
MDWTARACIRIGEISRGMEKAEAHGGKICLPSDGKAKTDTLAAAIFFPAMGRR